MTPTRKAVAAIIRKDLLVEFRERESLPAMALFAVSTFVVFHFALDARTVEGDLASGVLWVTLLFSALLGIHRTMAAEVDQGGFDGLLMAPIDRSAVLLAKAIVLFLYMCLLDVLVLIAFAVLLLGPELGSAVPELVPVLLLANVGIAAIGTLVAGITVHARVRELIVPLLSLPLLLPVLIPAARATEPLLSAPQAGSPEARWLIALALYDMVFALVAYVVYDFLLDD